jgi:hypothetical protein
MWKRFIINKLNGSFLKPDFSKVELFTLKPFEMVDYPAADE